MSAKIEVTPAEWNKIQQELNRKNQCKQNSKPKEKIEVKNKLTDLNNHLFAELERLGDEELSDEALDKEIARAKGIAEISEKIISNANLTLKAAEFLNDAGYGLTGTVESTLMGYVGDTQEDKFIGFKDA